MAEITELENNTTFDSIVRKLMSMNNCKRFNNIRIKNVNTEKNEDNDKQFCYCRYDEGKRRTSLDC